jgi:hypothetical protein
MRWRTIEEVKVSKGEKICANIACGRNEGLEGMEVLFGYVEDGVKRDVLVKCVVCEKCGRKLRKAKGTVRSEERKRSRKKEELGKLEKSVEHRFEWTKSKSLIGNEGQDVDGAENLKRGRDSAYVRKEKGKSRERNELDMKKRKLSDEHISEPGKSKSRTRHDDDGGSHEKTRKRRNQIDVDEKESRKEPNLGNDKDEKAGLDKRSENVPTIQKRDIHPVGKRAIMPVPTTRTNDPI